MSLLLCQCNAIFEHEVQACIRRGARRVDGAGGRGEAGTGGGSCRGATKTMIEEEAQRRRAGADVPDALFQLPLFAAAAKKSKPKPGY